MEQHEHVEVIQSGRHTYGVEMGGTVDGVNTRSPVGYQVYDQAFEPNVSVQMENVGNTPVVNPWLIVNGRDWRTVEAIVEGVVTPDMDDAEKALALWTFQRGCRFHATPYDRDNGNVVRMLNVYGYSLCGDDSYALADLWRAAGLRVRTGHPVGHSTTEVFYNGMWHLLDGDEHVICLMRDNKTIVGEAEIVADHDLMKRTHVYGVLRQDERDTDEFSASLFFYEGEREEEKGVYPAHQMAMILRPGEALTWRWDGKGKFHGRENMGSWRNAWTRVCNGVLRYQPDLGGDTWRHGAVKLENLASEGAFRMSGSGEATAVFEMKSPYVIVGGRIRARFRRTYLHERVALAVSFDRETWVEVWSGDTLGEVTADVCLDRLFSPEGEAYYGVDVRVSLQGDGPKTCELSALMLESDLQMAPLSLPGVQLGANDMVYVDETEGVRQVQVTHVWQERSDRRPPTAPESAVFPVDGTEVEGTQFTFEWTPATDVDGGEIVESHFQLSPRKDMAYVLSPNFEKLTSRTGDRTGTVCAYRIPYEGLLNPQETYYWRVRARNDAGIWGDWSSVWQFTPQGPGIPLDVAVKVDRKSRCGTLSWRANSRGRTPVRYLVYGSNEQGFTASDDPYLVTVAKGRQETFSANLMMSTERTELDVIGPNLDLKNVNSGFYRVAAVDEQGVRSGVSDLATVSRPQICSSPETLAKVGQDYVCQVEVVRSIGDLQTRVIDGNPYNPAFRNADELVFTLVDAPEWLRVDENGKITGYPTQMGRCEVTIRVTCRQGGQDEQVYILDMTE